jgi:hypothetical protein
MSPLTAKRLLAILGNWFEPSLVSNVFEPLLADSQHEWIAATGPWRRTAATVRGFLALLLTIGRVAPGSMFSPIPASVLGSAMIRVALFCAPITLLMLTPFLGWWMAPGPPLPALSWAYLVPGALVIPIPFAMILIVDLVCLNPTLTTWAKRRIVLQFALLSVVLMIAGLGWLAPSANQSWREAWAYARTGNWQNVGRGLRELSVFELLRHQPLPVDELFKRAFLVMLPAAVAVSRWLSFHVPAVQGASGTRIEAVWVLANVALITASYLLAYGLGGHFGVLEVGTVALWTGLLTVAAVFSDVCNRAARRNQATA